MNYRFAFVTTDKPLPRQFAAILRQGARTHRDTIETASLQDLEAGRLDGFDGYAKIGLARATKTIYERAQANNKLFLYFDKGYVKERYWRVSIDAWQPTAYFQRFKRPPDRWADTGIRLSPRRENGSKIVLAGACQNYSNFCNLGNVTEYNTGVVQQLRQHSDRPIVYRPNPSWAANHADEFREIEGTELSPPNESFKAVLDDAHLLVTHGSSAAVAAYAAGVPVMVLGDGIARPVATTAFAEVETPVWLKERKRQQFFCDLAYAQWTLQEYRSGHAWSEIRLALAALRGGPTDEGDIIALYRLMHKGPYFRGLSIVKYADTVQTLIRNTISQSLLDYGSGKGEQYREPYNLAAHWRVPITCYDPGVREHAMLPGRQFDGVICCDVMEHVLEHWVDATLQQVMKFATKFVFFAIASVPAKKVLPDGRNCHLTVRPEQWWRDRIAAAQAAVNPALKVVTVVTAEENADVD